MLNLAIYAIFTIAAIATGLSIADSLIRARAAWEQIIYGDPR